MTTGRLEPESAVAAVEPTILPQAVRHRIFLYLGTLVFLSAFGSPSAASSTFRSASSSRTIRSLVRGS
jgi:hypothetical protein